MIRNQWYIACESRELGKAPIGRQMLGEPVVLFRDEAGRPAAIVDRCSHRNVQLSKGRVENGCLRCPYHGWEFDAEGRCVHVPSLQPGEGVPNAAHLKRYPLEEQDGYLWVWIGDRAPESAERPFGLPESGPGWGHARLSAVIPNAVENVIENFIDTSHTGYIHGGLFRKPASHTARQHVQAVADGVIIDIDEDQEGADSLFARLLIPQGARVTHQDRFYLPAIVRVAYGFGPERQIVGYQLCTPEDAWSTRVHVHVNFRMGLLNALIRPLVPVVGKVILNQDMLALASQSEVLQRDGKRFTSVPADTANLWIHVARQRALKGEPPPPARETRVEYRL